MKANELMIGDWVLHPVSDMPDKVVSLTSDIEFNDGCFYRDADPIPLTPEILEKNGFEECCIKEIEYFGWRLNEDFSLELNAIDTLIWNDDVAIHSVHQLQHALRLCNIDKEIEL